MQAVNLIPDARRDARRSRRHARRWSVAGVIYALALVGIWLIAQSIFGGADRALAEQLNDIDKQRASAAEQIRKLEPRLAEAQTTLAASRSVGSQPDWSLLLNLLAQQLGEEVLLTSCRLEPASATGPVAARPADGQPQQHYRVRLAGLGLSQRDVSDYLLRLEKTGLFSRVTLIDTRKEPFRDTLAVGFRMECELEP
ncbi:MAG: PilN domain-containing protein [Phycisphaeraceae bacterium]